MRFYKNKKKMQVFCGLLSTCIDKRELGRPDQTTGLRRLIRAHTFERPIGRIR